MFNHLPISYFLFLFMEMMSLNNVSDDHNIRQCLIIDRHRMSFFSSSRWDHWTFSVTMNTFPVILIIDRHPMSFFPSWRWDHWRISLTMDTFGNVSSFSVIRCSSSFHRYDIIQQFFLAGSHSPMFDHWRIPGVSFCSSRWDHWTISLKMNTFDNLWSLPNIWCPFCFHRDQMVEQFVLAAWHSRMFDHSPTCAVLFLFIEIISLDNFF